MDNRRERKERSKSRQQERRRTTRRRGNRKKRKGKCPFFVSATSSPHDRQPRPYRHSQRHQPSYSSYPHSLSLSSPRRSIRPTRSPPHRRPRPPSAPRRVGHADLIRMVPCSTLRRVHPGEVVRVDGGRGGEEAEEVELRFGAGGGFVPLRCVR